jgi:predicted dehydrogenase
MIRVGVVGCGYWGPNIVRTFHDLEGAVLAKVADLRLGRREFISKHYPSVETTDTASEIIDDPTIDAVVIATPPNTHYGMAMQALDKGKHLLVEKPLTMNSHEADEVVRLAAARNRVLMVGHLFLYAPAVVKLNSLIEQGDLGEIYCISSTRANIGPPNTAVDVLWDLAPHDFSIILHLMKEYPVEIAAHAAAFTNTQFSEAAFVFLRFPSGAAAHVHVSWLTPNKTRGMQVIGSRRVVSYDEMQSVHKLQVFEAGVDNRVSASAKDAMALSYGPGSVWLPALEQYEPLRAQCEDFLRCIQTGQAPVSDGRKGAEVVRILETASRAMARQCPPSQEMRDSEAASQVHA